MATRLLLPLHLPVLLSNKSSMLLLSWESQGPPMSRGLGTDEVELFFFLIHRPKAELALKT